MTTSETAPTSAYVWVWLPDATKPIVAGRVDEVAGTYYFTYGRSYLGHENAMSLYEPELPLRSGRISPSRDLSIAGCLRDAGPAAWGQRVILARRLGHLDARSDTGVLSVLTYLLESGSDRVGALDFQTSPSEYEPRSADHPQLADMQEAADRVAAGRRSHLSSPTLSYAAPASAAPVRRSPSPASL